MTIQMRCACGTDLSFEDAQLGQSGPCYKCGQTLTVTPMAAPATSPVAATAAAAYAPTGQPPMGQPPMGQASFPNPQFSSRGDIPTDKEGWAWRYSPLVGVMYGPIPVGIIIVAVCGLVYLAMTL